MITKTPSEILSMHYGSKPPLQCLGRLVTEQNIVKRSYYEDLRLIKELRDAAEKDGSDVSETGPFLNWLLGNSSINPLPPHYRCTKCKKTLFYQSGDGWDLPAMECCGQPMVRDGHNIPVELLLSELEDPDRNLEFRIAKSFREQAHEIIRSHFEEDFVLIPYFSSFIICNDPAFALVPKGDPLPELDEKGIWHTNREEMERYNFRSIWITCTYVKEQLRGYRLETGLRPSIDDLLTEQVLVRTQDWLTNKIQENGGLQLRSDKLCFSSLLKMFCYLHSTHSRENPLQFNKNAKYSDIFCCREDVFYLLLDAIKNEPEISMEFAKKVVHRTSLGSYQRSGMDPDTKTVLRGLGISDHWIIQMVESSYLPRKSNLIDGLLEIMEKSWFELQETE